MRHIEPRLIYLAANKWIKIQWKKGGKLCKKLEKWKQKSNLQPTYAQWE